MKLIILAAGDSFELDGFNKLMINHPNYNKSIIELYEEFFNVDAIEIVVGYRAIEIMNAYPKYDYIYNKKWQTTGSAYSLSLALTDEPCYVISSDFLIDIVKVKKLLSGNNYSIIKKSESRRLTSLNAKINSDSSKIIEVYRGKSYNNDPEILGIFKLSDPKILRLWKRNCIMEPNSYAGETLPYKENNISTVYLENEAITEINTPEDYINFIKKCKDDK
jgi:choline kinase